MKRLIVTFPDALPKEDSRSIRNALDGMVADGKPIVLAAGGQGHFEDDGRRVVWPIAAVWFSGFLVAVGLSLVIHP